MKKYLASYISRISALTDLGEVTHKSLSIHNVLRCLISQKSIHKDGTRDIFRHPQVKLFRDSWISALEDLEHVMRKSLNKSGVLE